MDRFPHMFSGVVVRFLRIIGFGFLVAAAVAQNETKVTTVPNVKTIPYSEDRADVSVTTEGVVVWVDPSPVRFIYLQDRNAGIRVNAADDAELPATGDLVRIRGRLAWNEQDVEIHQAKIEVLGHPGMPKSQRASSASMANGAETGTRVHTRGFLRHAQKEGERLRIMLDSDGVRIPVLVVDADQADVDAMIGRYAYLSGVVSRGTAPGSFEVLVGSFADFYFRKRESNSAAEPMPIADLFRFRRGYNSGDRRMISGKILGILGDEIHLNDGTGGIVVRGDDPGKFVRGNWIKAVGFPEYDDGVTVFSDAVLEKTEPVAVVKPVVAEARDLLNPAANHRYVSVTGKLVDFMKSSPEVKGIEVGSPLVLVLNSNGTLFEATIPSSPKNFRPEAGALLKATGVCQISPDQTTKPGGFNLLVFSPDGVEVVKGPAFFNERRLLILLCATLLILAVTALWAYRAAKKNAELIAEVRERKAITAERGRLAGDLHDTLEQMLTAIHLQLHSLGPDSEMPEAARSGIKSIRDLVRQCHVEIRNFVWDLRPAALEHYDLPRALERMGRSLVLGSNTRISVKRPAVLPKIPTFVEDNLLRIGQEALTNAVKHGHPQAIEIRLDEENGLLVLEIEDDGSGLSSDMQEGFGLRGMKERVKRIEGEITISPGNRGGAIVRVTVPFPRKNSAVTSSAVG